MKLPKFNKPISAQMGYKSKIAIIVIGSFVSIAFLIFTQRIAQELKEKELFEARQWTRAMAIESNPNDINTQHNIRNLRKEILSNGNDKPFIITDKNLRIQSSMNINNEILVNPDLYQKELEDMANENEPIEVAFHNGIIYYIFHRESTLLKMMQYMPYVQIFTLAMLIGLIIISYSSSKNNEQNKIWVGMAKETAHQLGTPSSSLLGWLEYLRNENIDPQVIEEIEKDISRLLKVVDRFSKIGSSSGLVPKNVVEIVRKTITYFQVRKPKNVTIELTNGKELPIMGQVNEALLEWVMENTVKNAIDAVSGNGAITVSIYNTMEKVIIDIKDSGKGILKSNFKKVFQPGFSTKTRGWGLGLSLCKRIIDENHGGKMYVAESKVGIGTIMRVEVKKAKDEGIWQHASLTKWQKQ